MKDHTPKNWSHQAPKNTVLYAIGDLHGHLQPHNNLYTLIEIEASKQPEKQHIIIYLGDYIDRGPASAQIIEKLISLQHSDSTIQHHFLKGNHEAGLLGFLNDPHGFANWLDYGGIETAESYGISFNKRLVLPSEREDLSRALKKNIPQSHLNFLNALEKITIYGDYAFVHAGIKPDVALKSQAERDLTFIREPFLSWDRPHEKCIVHGHTITKKPDIKPNRIGLDTGLYQNHVLSCGILEENHVKILQVTND